MKIKTFLFVMALGSVSLWGMGQMKGSQEESFPDQPYDVTHEVTVKGRIEKIDPAPCAALPISSYHVHLKTATEKVEIHLGPCWFVVEQKPVLKIGDDISVLGSEISEKAGNIHFIVAREILRGSTVWRFRDESGNPVWKKGGK